MGLRGRPSQALSDAVVQYPLTATTYGAAQLLDGGTLSPGSLPGFYAYVVPPGAGGKAWRFVGAGGSKLLMTTPTHVALAADELLLPREVVLADGLTVAAPTVSPTPVQCASACN